MGVPQEIPQPSRDYPRGWREPAQLTLDEFGMIRDCNKAGEDLFAYSLRDLVSLHISILLPQLARIELLQKGQLNPRLNYLCHCGHVFLAQSRDGGTFSSELAMVWLERPKAGILRLFVLPSST